VKEARRRDLAALVAAVRRDVTREARLYLVSTTSHLAEGWREPVPRFELAGDLGAADLERAVIDAASALDIAVVWESPAEVIPLPSGSADRARPVSVEVAGAGGPLEVLHFDPYSVVLRLVARGDEPDYVNSLEYLRRGWVELARLEALLADVLPRFTSATLAQDPAEFRRKFRGLRQLHTSEVAPGDARILNARASD
jgi:hypothetical protein